MLMAAMKTSLLCVEREWSKNRKAFISRCSCISLILSYILSEMYEKKRNV